jgi:hypothetical protein
MAKIALSGLISDIRGKVGGVVFAKNRTSGYSRIKVTPTNPRSSFQTGVRAILSEISQLWRQLTEGQRQEWDNVAESITKSDGVGGRYKTTGKNLYVGLGANRKQIGLGALSSPPVFVEVQEPVITSLEVSVGDSEILLETDNIALGNTFVIEATKPLSAGVSFTKGLFRVIDITGDPGSTNIWNAYVAKFGAPKVGEKLAVRVIPIVTNTGQKGFGSQKLVIAE